MNISNFLFWHSEIFLLQDLTDLFNCVNLGLKQIIIRLYSLFTQIRIILKQFLCQEFIETSLTEVVLKNFIGLLHNKINVAIVKNKGNSPCNIHSLSTFAK